MTSTPDGLTVGLTDADTAIPKIWVGGGVDKVRYVISILASTSQGRSKEVNFEIKIKDS